MTRRSALLSRRPTATFLFFGKDTTAKAFVGFTFLATAPVNSIEPDRLFRIWSYGKKLPPFLLPSSLSLGCFRKLSKGAPFSNHLGVFQRKALLLEATIPFGYISTYRELARACGNPLATRAVARALSHNPLPLLIPCHRVIGSDGSLLGYQGGIGLKRHLLEREEIPFSSLAIDLKRANLWVFLS